MPLNDELPGPTRCRLCAFCSRRAGGCGRSRLSMAPPPFISLGVGVAFAHHAGCLVRGGLWPFVAVASCADLDLVHAARQRLHDAGHSSGARRRGVPALCPVGRAASDRRPTVSSTRRTVRWRTPMRQARCGLFSWSLYIVAALLGSSAIRSRPGWWSSILTLMAFLPIIVALAFTVWTATRPSVEKPDAALRLWLEHASRRHAQACAGRGADRRGAADELSLRHHGGRLCLGRAGARAIGAWLCCGGLRRATASRSMVGRISRAGFIAPKFCRCGRQAGRRPALVYLARPRPVGAPKPGYMEIVVAAARELELPADYIASLARMVAGAAAGRGPS